MSIVEGTRETETVPLSSALQTAANIYSPQSVSAQKSGRNWISTFDTKQPTAEGNSVKPGPREFSAETKEELVTTSKQTGSSLKRRERIETGSPNHRGGPQKRIKAGRKPSDAQKAARARQDETIRAWWKRNRNLFELEGDNDSEPGSPASSPSHCVVEALGQGSDQSTTPCYPVLSWIENQLQRIQMDSGETFELTDTDTILRSAVQIGSVPAWAAFGECLETARSLQLLRQLGSYKYSSASDMTMLHFRIQQMQLRLAGEQYTRVRRNLIFGDFWLRYQKQVDIEQKSQDLAQDELKDDGDLNRDNHEVTRPKSSYKARQAAGRVLARLIKQVWPGSSELDRDVWYQRKVQVWNLLKEAKLVGALAKSLHPLLPALIPATVTRLRLSEAMLNVLIATIKEHKPSLLRWLGGFQDFHSALLEETSLPDDLAPLEHLTTVVKKRGFEKEMDKFISQRAKNPNSSGPMTSSVLN